MKQDLDGPLRHAYRIARTKSQHKFAFHSVIVQRGGATVGSGYNFGSTHAEVNALSKLWPSKRRGCKIWSIRVTKGGKLANARPCDECFLYLKKNGIKVVWYSDSNGLIKKIKVSK